MIELAEVKVRIKAEIPRMMRFAVVGGASLALYSGLYALLSRVLWIEGNRTLQTLITGGVTAVCNFFGHRRWTFERHQSAAGYTRHMFRYLIVLVSALFIQSTLFWIGHEKLDLYDFFVLYPVVALVSLYTYSMHRWFTFR